MEPLKLSLESLLVPSGVTLRAKEYSALIVVETVHFVSERREVRTDFRADKTGGTGDEDGTLHRLRNTHTDWPRFPIPDIVDPSSSVTGSGSGKNSTPWAPRT